MKKGSEAKSNLNIYYILETLRKFTNESNFMTKKNIKEKIALNYSDIYGNPIDLSIKTIERLLLELIDSKEVIIKGKKGNSILYYATNSYFSDSEMLIILYNSIFSRTIPYNISNSIVERVKSIKFYNKNKNIKDLINYSENINIIKDYDKENFLEHLNIIIEAINSEKNIIFRLSKINRNKEKVKLNEEWINESPYYITIIDENFYVLLGNSNGLVYRKIERFFDIKIDEKTDRYDYRTNKNKLIKNYQNILDKYKYDIYALNSEVIRATIEIKESDLFYFHEWYGSDYIVDNKTDVNEEVLRISFRINKESLRKWAKRYSEIIVVVEPQELRDTIISDLNYGIERYKKI